MKTIITSILLMSCLVTFGQSNLVVFSQEGQPFFLLVNGKAQNSDPSSNVRVTGLNQPNVLVKIKFEDEKIADIDRNIMLESNMEYVAVVKPNRKGELVLRYQSASPLANSSASAGQSTVIYNPNGVSMNTSSAGSGSTSSAQTTTTTTTTSNTGGNGETISVNINMGKLANSMKSAAQSVNETVDASFSSSASSTSTTTTTTNSGGSAAASSGGQLTARVVGNTIQLSDGRTLNWQKAKIKGMVGSEVEMKEPLGAKVTLSYDGKEVFNSEVPFFYREKDYSKYSSYIKISVVETNGATWSVKMQQSNTVRILIDSWANGGGGTTTVHTTAQTAAPSTGGDCAYTMSPGDFESAKSSISSKTFEDSKMTLAKQIGKSNCFTTDQVKAICNLFTYEDSKLEFAKYAYSRTQDKGNYFKINDVFTYESSIDELNEFLEQQ